MEAVFTSNTNHSIYNISTQVNANELQNAFNHYADKIKLLSLDCFDTLLWRTTIEPKDVFFDLQQSPTFLLHGIRAVNRIDAESNARHFAFTRFGHYEVTLNDIYKAGFPTLDQATIDQLIDEEIQAEMSACYAYYPILDLMQAAIDRGIKVVIVSNTYLKEHQLRRLLEKALPYNFYQVIERIYCSCDYNQSKNNGLFTHLLSQYGYSPKSILHIGDNYAVDFDGAKAHNINALHLNQYNKKITDYLRLQATAATIADASLHYTRAMVNPFKGLFALNHSSSEKAESVIGYMSLGPIMYTFAQFIHEEVEKLKAAGKKPKVLFMLRDAYLPYLASEAFEGKSIGHLVRISRLTAMTASFRTKKDIESYLATKPELSAVLDTCKRLTIPDIIMNEIFTKVKSSTQPTAMLIALMCQDEFAQFIFKQSKIYFERLKKHINKEANIQSGDTIMLVDLGYNGRTQQMIAPILQNEMNVEVTGRYLISLNVLQWQKSRSGLLDPSWCDDRSLHAITQGCSLLEELCTSADYSVINYDNNGECIFTTGASNNEIQQQKTKLIQAEAIRFIHDAKKYFAKLNKQFSLTMLRDVAIAELARRTYFSLIDEINFLQNFKHDFNFGMNVYGLAMDSIENELISLRRMGLWFKNQTPYGVRAASFALSLALMSQRRHGFAIQLDDLSLIKENILVLKAQGQQMNKEIIGADPTFDGYYSLWLPLDKHTLQVAIMFGLNYKIMQLESIYLIKANHFYSDTQYQNEKNIRDNITFNDLIEKETGLFECVTESGTILIPTNSIVEEDEKYILRVIFRPIIRRTNN